MIGQIVAHIEVLNLSILAEFLKNIFIKVLKVLLQFARIRLLDVSMLIHAAVKSSVWRLVHVGEQQRLTCCWPIVKTGAAVSMAAHSNLEIKRTIDSIFLGSKDGSEMLRHDG
jgi:hypothetical protein